ncbi:TPA: hypothetical protein ACMDN4_000235 [Vibrio cholerae]
MKKIETSKNLMNLIFKSAVLIILYLYYMDYALAETRLYLDKNLNVSYVRLSYTDLITEGRRIDSALSKHHYIVLSNKRKEPIAQFACPLRHANPVPTYELKQDRNGPLWYKYTTFAEEEINNCTAWFKVTSNEIDEKNIKYWTVYVDDGHQSGGYPFNGLVIKHIPYESTPSVPSSCKSEVFNNINFGIINKQPNESSISAYGIISTICENKASLTISVNNGQPLYNSDGSTITFNYEKYLQAEKEIPISIAIQGNLITPPQKPGAYKWYVPILINYE